MDKVNIGVIGFGIVGQALANGFKDENIRYFDKYKKSISLNEVLDKSEFIFICLPTPTFLDGSGIDLSIIEETISKITPKTNGTNKIIVIKSTVTPGTTLRLQKKYPKSLFAFNPEFLRELTYLEDFLKPDRTVLGSIHKMVLDRLTKLYKDHFPKVPIFQTDPTSAEMVKYMANAYLAMKVLFAYEIYDLCQKLGIDYMQVKKMVVADKRIKDTHLNVETVNSNTKNRKGFGGKCLPKDLMALLSLGRKLKEDLSLLEAVWQKNLRIRMVHDWEELPFVTSKNKYV